MKTLLYISASAVLFMPTVSASEPLIERQNAYSQLPKSAAQSSYPELPLVLRPFVCHEGMPGISNNVILGLTQAQYDRYYQLIHGLPYVSFKITDQEPRSTNATQGSQASIAPTVPVDLSQSSLESSPATQPFKPTS